MVRGCSNESEITQSSSACFASSACVGSYSSKKTRPCHIRKWSLVTRSLLCGCKTRSNNPRAVCFSQNPSARPVVSGIRPSTLLPHFGDEPLKSRSILCAAHHADITLRPATLRILEIFEQKGSFCVGLTILGREHSLLWSRISNRKNAAENNSDSDVQLFERLKQRDEHAFLRLYDRHGQSVYRFLVLMTGSVAIAEDLTQEAFVVILNAMCSGSIAQFDPEKGRLEGYLLGIARNLARAERRRAHRMLPLDNVTGTPEWERLLHTLFLENKTWDVPALLAARCELTALSEAILELPSHYREVVVLCSLEQKSYHEAAALLQCSEGTIASRMNRAKALLAAKLRRSTSTKMNASVI